MAEGIKWLVPVRALLHAARDLPEPGADQLLAAGLAAVAALRALLPARWPRLVPGRHAHHRACVVRAGRASPRWPRWGPSTTPRPSCRCWRLPPAGSSARSSWSAARWASRRAVAMRSAVAGRRRRRRAPHLRAAAGRLAVAHGRGGTRPLRAGGGPGPAERGGLRPQPARQPSRPEVFCLLPPEQLPRPERSVLFVHDLGPERNRLLLEYLPGRTGYRMGMHEPSCSWSPSSPDGPRYSPPEQ